MGGKKSKLQIERKSSCKCTLNNRYKLSLYIHAQGEKRFFLGARISFLELNVFRYNGGQHYEMTLNNKGDSLYFTVPQKDNPGSSKELERYMMNLIRYMIKGKLVEGITHPNPYRNTK